MLAIWRVLMVAVAIVILVAGLILLPLPIPLGLPLLLLAAGMLASLFPSVRRFLERFVHRHPRYLGWLEHILHRIRERQAD